MVFDLGAGAGACSLVANITVPPKLCGVPHELAIMTTEPRDVYLACVGGAVAPVAGPTSVVRFVASSPAPAARVGRLRG